MKKVIVVMAVLALLALGVTNAFAAPALDKSGVQDGPIQLSISQYLPPLGTYTGGIYTTLSQTDPINWLYKNVHWTQPKLSMLQDGKTYNAFGICIDSMNPWDGGSQPYMVGNYVPVVSTIENQAAWNKLTHLWSSSIVTVDSDRAAVQLATWKICAGDWSVARTGSGLANYWMTGDGIDYGFKVNDMNNLAVLTKALGYITNIAGSEDKEVAGYKTLTNTLGKQNFATAVPEPGTILAAISILAPAAMIFRRRKQA